MRNLNVRIAVYIGILFIMRLDINIITSYGSLTVILVTIFSSLKLENGMKKQVRNVA